MKMRKRGRGEGSVYQRKDGQWTAAVTLGRDPATGKVKRAVFYAKSRREAAEKLAKALGEIERGTFAEPGKMTLKEWLETWLKEYVAPKVRPNTWKGHAYVIRRHIVPALGAIPLKKLLPAHLQKLYNAKREAGRVRVRKDGPRGLSPRTVRIIHVTLHAALDQAVKEGLLARNPADAVSLPRQEKREIRVLTREEQERLFKVLAKDRLGPAFILILGAGLRRGEALGLRWADVDLQEGSLRVEQNLLRVKRPGEGKSRLSFEEPKTKKGRRTVPIPGWAVEALRAHKVRQNKERLALGEAYQDHGLVFATEIGTPIEPRNLNRHFELVKRDAGIPKDVTIHALRHTFATRLLEAGENPKVVQEMLGHSQISVFLDIYAHVLPDLKERAADRLEDLWPKELSVSAE